MRSAIDDICKPLAANALIAISRPAPGPVTTTSTSRMPCSMALRAALSAVTCAAYGVLLRDPRNPEPPALAQATAFPAGSVNVTIVLLNVERMNASPRGIFLRSRLRTRVLPRPRLRSAIVAFVPFPGHTVAHYACRIAPRASSGVDALYAALRRRLTVRFGPRRVRALVLVR